MTRKAAKKLAERAYKSGLYQNVQVVSLGIRDQWIVTARGKDGVPCLWTTKESFQRG